MTVSRRFRKKAVVFFMLHRLMRQTITALILIIAILEKQQGRKRLRRSTQYSLLARIPDQVSHLNRMIYVRDDDCISNCQMDRNAFARFCFLLREIGGLVDQKYVSVEEQVAMFLSVLAHHKKNRVVKFNFQRSGHTVSKYIHLVLKSVLRIHTLLLVQPQPVENYSTSQRWKWFQGCLGALDGTYVPVHVSLSNKPRYRTRKWQISTNVLAACNRDMNFVYVLPGWEGSAADARVLRDAVNRPNGLKVPRGNYYLCDNGYANSEGFLSPFRGVRYHLDEWTTSSTPANYEEHFNMRHTRARNVIERAFGIMKMRWGILRNATFYPIKVQTRLIMATFLIHNFIRSVMPVDPFEVLLDEHPQENIDEHDDDDQDFIETVEATPRWNAIRREMALTMYDRWVLGR